MFRLSLESGRSQVIVSSDSWPNVLPQSDNVGSHFITLLRANWPETCRGSEPCERRDARVRRETVIEGPSPAQVADLRLLCPRPGDTVSRGVERFAERHVSGQPFNIK